MKPPPARPAVLIVEDEAMVLTTLALSLEREQFKVSTCSNPLKALEIVASVNFAVIISDQRMPEMNGLDFLQECRRISPHSSRMLLTAYLDPASVLAAINRGDICRYISKPWLREELLGAVRDAAQRHELTVDNHTLRAENRNLREELAAVKKAILQPS